MSLLLSLEQRDIERECWTIFPERAREGHRQTDEHWNRFKGNVGETSEREGGAHMCFPEHVDTILNLN